MNKSNVLVFGAGQISNLLINELTFTGKKVLCVSNNKSGQINNLSHQNLDILSYGEILNKKVEVDTAIFAWKDSTRLISDSHAILNWLKSGNFLAKKTFHLGSASVYKDSKAAQNENCKVLEKNKKLELENILTNIAINKELVHINLRISNVYGKEVSYGFIGELFDSIRNNRHVGIFQNLNITRDYVHVHDVIYAIKLLLEIDTDLKSINISTGIGTTIRQVLKIFANQGYHFEKRKVIASDPLVKQSSILDCKALSNLIEWKPISVGSAVSKILTE